MLPNDAGVYVLQRRVLGELPERGNIEEALFPKLAKERRLRVVVFKDVFWRSADSLKDLEGVDRYYANEH